MSMQHDDAMLDMVATYALGAIDATTGECAAVRAHLAECAICREEFRRAQAATAALALSAATPPPPGLRERILASLPAARPTTLQSYRRRSWFTPAVAAAAVLIAAGLYWQAHRAPAKTWAAACVPAASDCHASGTVSAQAGVLHVRLQGLAALPAGKQYQAWMILPGGAPKPEPVFSPDKQGSGTVDMPESPVKGAVVAITVEPAGGSKAPTSAPFMVAKLD